jgi:hypothetical protein
VLARIGTLLVVTTMLLSLGALALILGGFVASLWHALP